MYYVIWCSYVFALYVYMWVCARLCVWLCTCHSRCVEVREQIWVLLLDFTLCSTQALLYWVNPVFWKLLEILLSLLLIEYLFSSPWIRWLNACVQRGLERGFCGKCFYPLSHLSSSKFPFLIKPNLLILSICVCTCSYVCAYYVCMAVHVYVCRYKWRPETKVVYLQLFSSYFSRQVSHWAWNTLVHLDWLTIELGLSLSPPLGAAEIISNTAPQRFSYMSPGVLTQVLMLAWQGLYLLSHLCRS